MDSHVRECLNAFRRKFLFLPLLGALALFVYLLNGHIEIGHWLVWRFAAYWLVAAVFSLACVSGGTAIVRAIGIPSLDFGEELVLGFPCGVLLFGLCLYAAGFAGMLHPWFFITLPLVLIVSGMVGLGRRLRGIPQSHRPSASQSAGLQIWQIPILLFGFLALAAIYFACLTPENVCFDARFYHLSLAEHYLAQGGIRATPEGWWAASVPHLATIIYTWAFGLPHTILFDRIGLAMHLEFTIFLWTLAALPFLVRRLVPGARASLAWVAMFLFPGLFLYDSNLSLGADHITAFWGGPIFICLLLAWHDLRPRTCALLGVMIAGATLTKYQAVYLLPGPALALVARGIWLFWRDRRGGVRGLWASRGWRGPALALLTVTVLTTPHWLKNWAFYGDPIYPFLHNHLNDHPWTPDSAYLLENNSMIDKAFQTLKPPADKLRETTRVLATFSFKPHDYFQRHGNLPVFGSLFTLLVFCLPFVRAGARVWGLFFAAHMGVFVWYWTYHTDRYLQNLLPWMAAATASVLILVWRSGWPARLLVCLLVTLQVIWGGDVYFIPTHAMVESPAKASIDLILTSFRGNFVNRLNIYEPYAGIGRELPKDAKVYLRKIAIHLGMARMTVSDYGGFGISLGRLKSLQEIHRFLHGMGVTHLMWTGEDANGDWWDNLSADLIFYRLVHRSTDNLKRHGRFSVAALGPEPAGSTEQDEKVLYLGCPGDLYSSGIYQRTQLVRYPAQTDPPPVPLKYASPTSSEEVSLLIRDVAYIVHATSCQPALPADATTQFESVGQRERLQYWLRRPEKVEP